MCRSRVLMVTCPGAHGAGTDDGAPGFLPIAGAARWRLLGASAEELGGVPPASLSGSTGYAR